MTPRTRRGLLALACALTLAAGLTACGSGAGDGGSGGGMTTMTAGDAEMAVHHASYDLVVGEQRFIAGVSFADGTILAFGTVDLEFLYLGTRSAPLDEPRPGPAATAGFLPIAGTEGETAGPEGPDPRRVEPADALGVYGAEGVRFDDAGFWRVVLTAEVEGETLTAETAFGVNAEHQVPAMGDRAPDVAQPTAGTPGVDPKSIDSRARDGEFPDPHLHSTTVNDALAAGRPVLVVVSTPVYCVSRFCGPITDAVADLANSYGDRAAFVHIEVWQDFEAKAVNPAARAWMAKDPANQNLTEPWVFLVGADGVIMHRWDNVATVAEMTAALEALPPGT